MVGCCYEPARVCWHDLVESIIFAVEGEKGRKGESTPKERRKQITTIHMYEMKTWGLALKRNTRLGPFWYGSMANANDDTS